MKRFTVALLVISIVAILCTISFVVGKNYNNPDDMTKPSSFVPIKMVDDVPDITQDESLVAIAENIGVSRKTLIDNHVQLQLVDKSDLVQSHPNSPDTQADSSAFRKKDGGFLYMRIRVSKEAQDQKRSLAHEILHMYWAKDRALANDKKLESRLIKESIYNPHVKVLLPLYAENDELSVEEIFAKSCPMTKDLDSYVAETCQKYIDRSAIDLVDK